MIEIERQNGFGRTFDFQLGASIFDNSRAVEVLWTYNARSILFFRRMITVSVSQFGVCRSELVNDKICDSSVIFRINSRW
jgi:hypothetical protein